VLVPVEESLLPGRYLSRVDPSIAAANHGSVSRPQTAMTLSLPCSDGQKLSKLHPSQPGSRCNPSPPLPLQGVLGLVAPVDIVDLHAGGRADGEGYPCPRQNEQRQPDSQHRTNLAMPSESCLVEGSGRDPRRRAWMQFHRLGSRQGRFLRREGEEREGEGKGRVGSQECIFRVEL
jgi:hypothetical protein